MEKILGPVSEEVKGIFPLLGSSSGSNTFAISNTEPSSISEMALPTFSNQSPASEELSSMTVDQLVPNLNESNLWRQRKCDIDVKKLWESPGIAYNILKELLSVYKKLEPSKISIEESNRICDVLALLQGMASHPEVKIGLIKAKIPYYVYPFLQTTADDRALSHLRLSSLGVLGALVKCDDPQQAEIAVHFLLDTEAFPLCLRCMDRGSEHIQELATFIVMKILMQDEGLKYCCDHAERFFAVVQVLTRLVDQLAVNPRDENARMLQRVICCFLRLSEAERSTRVTESMRRIIPPKLTDDTFLELFQKYPDIRRMIQQFLSNLTPGLGPNP